MNSLHLKATIENFETEAPNMNEQGIIEENLEVSSLEDSSSIQSGSDDNFVYTAPIVNELIHADGTHKTSHISSETPMEQFVVLNTKVTNEFSLLSVGIFLTVLLAFFSCLLLFKINAIEKRNQHEYLHSSQIETVEDANSILSKNVQIVKNIRKSLEDLQELLICKNDFEAKCVTSHVA